MDSGQPAGPAEAATGGEAITPVGGVGGLASMADVPREEGDAQSRLVLADGSMVVGDLRELGLEWAGAAGGCDAPAGGGGYTL